MGLLKHAILPLYALIDLVLVYKCLIAEDIDDIMEAWGRKEEGQVPMTDLEHHLVHVLGGASLCLLVNCVAAIFVENSHYRGMAVLLQALLFVVDGYSYTKLNVPIPGVIFGIVGLGAVGLVVHSREPGIFTKDKDNKAKSG